ncbi:hypothetical protein EHR06_04890 [Leptospira dzoumogneensis]|uniref:DUF1554 domain-containing protein n=1 Tax=Leptospira dzoumogneensis TaxID=2484904 RepID=A0A4Z1ASX1_9LEPT|nr:hypothetical protein EHR06_04890 [Leptospira dzoumogneensis]
MNTNHSVLNCVVKFFAPLFFFLYFHSNACINAKTCSSEDRSCNFNEILYSYISVPPGIYLYSTQRSYQGNLAAYGSNLQLSMMNICYEARSFAQIISNCSNILPFTHSDSSGISTYTTDFSLDGTLPVRGARGELIYSQWNLLTTFSTPPLLSMNQAGVTSELFWTFTGEGVYTASDSCGNGQFFDNGNTGVKGDPNSLNNDWTGLFDVDTCDMYRKVLCICY